MKVKKFWGFIKDPIFGYIHLTETEKKILDTRPLQRLRRIRQVAGSEYVYPSANHTRLEHSLGVMHLAGLLAQNLPVNLQEDDIQSCRIAGLCHDVGHGPFSHVFEHILEKYYHQTHEDLTEWLIRESEISDVIRDEGFDPAKIGKLAIGNLKDKEKPFLDQIIRSAVDADKMDFLVRDSYHTGAEYGRVDIFRLIYTMDVLDNSLAVDLTALPTLEALVIARVEAFRTIYFHRTGRAAQVMLARALEEAKEAGELDFKTTEEYLDLDDYTVWASLKKCPKCKHIVDALERRQLLKCCYERAFYVKDQLITSLLTDEGFRSNVAERIALKSNLNPEEVVIDVPSLPSVPYHLAQTRAMDIPLFSKTQEGRKIPRKVTDLSQIIEVLQGFMNIIRVYTKEKYREKVMTAAGEVLGRMPASTEVSY
jgi:HD superfamily phosphohydrolase